MNIRDVFPQCLDTRGGQGGRRTKESSQFMDERGNIWAEVGYIAAGKQMKPWRRIFRAGPRTMINWGGGVAAILIGLWEAMIEGIW